MSFQRGRGRGRGIFMSSSKKVLPVVTRSITDNTAVSSTTTVTIRLHLDADTEEWFLRLRNMWNLRMLTSHF